MPKSSRTNDPDNTAVHEITPEATPKTDPTCSAKRRPNALASTPTGSVPIHMPTAMMLIGSVASAGSGASIDPTMPPVATMTVVLPPVSAWATASTTALRAARRSSVTSIVASVSVTMACSVVAFVLAPEAKRF